MLSSLEKKYEIERATMMTILVATLGYFVDIFDLLLFNIVRVQSLKDLQVPEEQLLETGIFLLNTQMAGLLVGGLIWGVWGDRMGRVSVLFGSILMYSIANILNGFVWSVEQYAVLRFISGIGLAGELGAGVTLASELLPRALRGLGTTFIASIGVAGAVFAAVVADIFDWRTAYVIGGIMGLGLLVLRFQVRESSMFEMMSQQGKEGKKLLKPGNPLILLRPASLRKYIAVIVVGMPLWAVVGLFITFTPEFAKDFGMQGELPTAGRAVLFCYVGLVIGDMFSGLLSQLLRSRKKAVAVFLTLTGIFSCVYVWGPHHSLEAYYGLCLLLGIGTGYWAMFVQMGAEQFGTNIRATAATSIPNMVRGSVILSTSIFQGLKGSLGVTMAGLSVVGLMLVLAFIALASLKETFGTDLDYLEE
ncbi:MAG: MFS transporter [Alphaproteobacteria bacterium]|nr:MFS transporter [Alphaproteobacteria bacterium]MBP7757978.1 MFS transporter [Alphaproteobacteria bacterium]MBP7761305.1 MFS transporter [Alphaproteobacteria bacterium]MBP7903753.1 MFS transporter [Alphaproteobacteria bacterium]